jgi:hypothetical protein
MVRLLYVSILSEIIGLEQVTTTSVLGLSFGYIKRTPIRRQVRAVAARNSIGSVVRFVQYGRFDYKEEGRHLKKSAVVY